MKKLHKFLVASFLTFITSFSLTANLGLDWSCFKHIEEVNAETSSATYRVFFTRPNWDCGWLYETPNIHYTCDSSPGTTWPGPEMTFSHLNSTNEDVYYYDLPSDANLVVVNSTHGDKSDQTVDIPKTDITPGVNWWLNGNRDGKNHCYYSVASYHYQINITLDKGAGEVNGVAKTIHYGDSLSSLGNVVTTHATKPNNYYNLLGYYTSSTGGSKLINADGTIVPNVDGYTNDTYWINLADNVTLYARFEGKIYTVTFSDIPNYNIYLKYTDGYYFDLACESLKIQPGIDQVVDYEKTGYTLQGYYDANTLKVKPDGTLADKISLNSTGNKTWTPVWNPNTYVISYADEGGDTYSGNNLSLLPAEHVYGIDTTLVNGTKDGMTFGGWYTDSNCTGNPVTTISGTDYTSNFTLYAKWINTSSSTVIIDYSSGGSGQESFPVGYHAASAIFESPTKRDMCLLV